MAKVSLRIYNREIEGLVDRGQLDEAIAHCRHILNTFPKNLETYRLLGKAYLEAKRYNEATDIFERVLMAVPDDFVAHVGMSIIHDEQKEMDAAIWHMERAFEVQSSNAAIQSELQRLFGRRDGVEPPKIRLTRGALAHMYVQGELYPQAISEIKAVLEEDRERQDMQVLLARAYFHAGQKSEAAEMCSQLLRRYPYCLDANRVLVELLPETERGENTQVYRKRVNELDPYATFTTGSVFQTDEVPDAAVSLDRLDWDGQPVEIGPEWGESMGIGRGEKATDDKEPDWLKTGLASASTDESDSVSGGLPIPSAGGEDEIPEFLREAGWGEDTGTFQEGLGIFDASDESEEPALAEGDLPDWVKAMAPTGADMQESTPQAGADETLEQGEIPDWLQGLSDEQDTSSDEEPAAEQAPLEGDLPDWLESMKPAEEAAPETQPQEQMMADSTSDDDLPDWLKSIKSEEEGEPEEIPQEMPSEPAEEMLPESQPQEQVMADAASDGDLPDWLKSMQSEEEGTAPGDVPQETPLEPTEEVLPESQPQEQVMADSASDEDLPDWLKSMQSEEEKAESSEMPQEMPSEPAEEMLPESQPPEQVMADASGDEDLPDWLKSIEAEEEGGALEETPQEMPSEAAMESEQEVPEMSDESLSDWQISEEATAESVAFDATDTGNLGTSADEQDDAIAWLEGLAAKHGAKPEELVTNPDDRTETEPEWVQRAKATQEQAGAEMPVQEEQPSGEVPADLPEFLSEEQAEPTEESTAEAPADLPGFLAEEHAVPAEEVGTEAGPVDVNALGTSAEEQDDAVAWLESLAAKHGAKPEELVTDPNARKETAPEWVQRAAEASAEKPTAEEASVEEPMEPELDEAVELIEEAPSAEAEGVQAAEPVSPASTDETGMWLRDMGEEGAVEEQPELTGEAEASAAEGDIPEWLREMEGETAETEAAPKSEEEASLPDWLRDIDEGPSESEGVPVSQPEAEAVSMPEQEVVSKIDINVASVEQLAELPGIGDLLAQNIVAYRETYGDFSSLDDLSNIAGIGPSTIDELRGLVEFQEVEVQSEEEAEAAEWLQSLEAESSTTKAEETFVEEVASEDLPSWLAGLDEEKEQPQPAMDADSDLPEWLRNVEEQQQPVEPEPTTPTDWTPAAEPSQEESAIPAQPEPEVEEPTAQAAPPAAPKPEPEPAPEPKPAPQTPPEREPYREPVTRSRSGMTGMLSAAQDPALTGAQIELTRGNIPGAMDSYGKLIKKGKLLDEIIFDLREALYRYPVEVSILQTLGDAYMRANRLQDALDSYTKAEELLR